MTFRRDVLVELGHVDLAEEVDVQGAAFLQTWSRSGYYGE